MEKENNATNPNKLGDSIDLSGKVLPKILVQKMLELTERQARQSGQDNEREENVCRLLASGMSVDEISLILKIRADEVRVIERNNTKITIPKYAKTYK